MNIEDFKQEFLQNLRDKAAEYQTDSEDMFIEESFEMFRDSGIISEPIRFYFGKNGRRNRMMQIHGYAYDDAESSSSQQNDANSWLCL